MAENKEYITRQESMGTIQISEDVVASISSSVALETECACLVLLRDINEPEDDSAALNAIAARYVNADGSPRIQRLEVNHWADLRKVKLPCTLISPVDFDRGAAWN